MCARVLRQEGALQFPCSKGQFSLEVADQSLSLREEAGEVKSRVCPEHPLHGTIPTAIAHLA